VRCKCLPGYCPSGVHGMMRDELSTTQRTMQTVSIELPNFSNNYIAWQGRSNPEPVPISI